jgi:hypothetical protein
MKTKFLSTVLGTSCALAAFAGTANADSVITINPDGSVAQVESTQVQSAQVDSGNAAMYQQNAATRGYSSRRRNTGNSASGSYPGYVGGVNAPVAAAGTASPWGAQGMANGAENPYGDPRNSSGSTRGAQVRNRSTLGNVTAQGRGRGGIGRNDRDIIIDGDDNTIIIWPGAGYGGGYYPGYGYGGYYPPYGWADYPVWGYPRYGYPRYGYPRHGYPSYGYPINAQPGYRYPSYGYPGYGYPSYGQPGGIHIFGPGTYSTSHSSTTNGGFGGFSLGTGGVNVTLGGGRQSVNSRSTTTVMPGTTVSTGTLSPFVMPGNHAASNPFIYRNHAPVGSTFVAPNRGSRVTGQRDANFAVRGNRRGF